MITERAAVLHIFVSRKRTITSLYGKKVAKLIGDTAIVTSCSDRSVYQQTYPTHRSSAAKRDERVSAQNLAGEDPSRAARDLRSLSRPFVRIDDSVTRFSLSLPFFPLSLPHARRRYETRTSKRATPASPARDRRGIAVYIAATVRFPSDCFRRGSHSRRSGAAVVPRLGEERSACARLLLLQVASRRPVAGNLVVVATPALVLPAARETRGRRARNTDAHINPALAGRCDWRERGEKQPRDRRVRRVSKPRARLTRGERANRAGARCHVRKCV